MIVTINGKATWRPNFVLTRKSETCRSFFTEIYGVDFYGCDDYGLPETEMAKLADAIREEFYDAAKYICDEHGLDAEKVYPGLEAGMNKGINSWAKDTAVYIENENEVRRPAYTMGRLWDEIFMYIDSACRTGGSGAEPLMIASPAAGRAFYRGETHGTFYMHYLQLLPGGQHRLVGYGRRPRHRVDV